MSAIAKGLEKRRDMADERLAAGLAREFSDVTDDEGEKRVVGAMLAAAMAVKQSGSPATSMRSRKRRAITADGNI